MQEISVRSHSRAEMIDITAQVAQAVAAAGLPSGWAMVFVTHTTAGITINENADPDVTSDLLGALERLVPQHGPYRHSEGNSDAHLKASLMGFSVTVPVAASRLVLGTWQGVYFCEFDGPRTRRVIVTTVGEK